MSLLSVPLSSSFSFVYFLNTVAFLNNVVVLSLHSFLYLRTRTLRGQSFKNYWRYRCMYIWEKQYTNNEYPKKTFYCAGNFNIENVLFWKWLKFPDLQDSWLINVEVASWWKESTRTSSRTIRQPAEKNCFWAKKIRPNQIEPLV